MSTFRTAREIIEQQRVAAKKAYDDKLEECRKMLLIVQSECPHPQPIVVEAWADFDGYTRCDDCGSITLEGKRNERV